MRRDPTWPLLTAWTLGAGVAHRVGPIAVSWHSFVRGTRLLLSPAAGHIYALHGALQIGPVTYLAVAPVVFGLPAGAGRIAAMALTAALGLVVLAQVRHLAPPPDRRARRRFVLAGLAAMTVWSQLAITYVHPDDALALLLAVVALRLLRGGRPLPAAVLLGLAADCKPWALAFAGLLWLADGRRLAAAGTYLATVAAAWLPFYLVDPRSLAAGSFRIRNVATSSLRVLGVHAAGTPLWDRPVQIGVGAALGLLAVRRGRWPAVILVAVCVRLLLDPSTKSYYDAGLLIGSVLCDLVLLSGPLPLFSLTALVLFTAPRAVLGEEPHGYGVVRTAYLLAVVGVLLLAPRLTRSRTGRSRSTWARPGRRHPTSAARSPWADVEGWPATRQRRRGDGRRWRTTSTAATCLRNGTRSTGGRAAGCTSRS